MLSSNSLPFYKYQGTGNDFILIDNRGQDFRATSEQIRSWCQRKTGVGADGLILLGTAREADFSMVYYNSDGNLSTMCGNGGRCIVSFAQSLGLVGRDTVFEAVDGLHRAQIGDETITLYMSDVDQVSEKYLGYFVDTGSPHYVQVMDDLTGWNVNSQGRRIRYEQFGDSGANVNFVEVLSDHSIRVRTYERGVEAETLSCGTGVTAAGIALHAYGYLQAEEVEIETLGGKLYVGFEKDLDGGYRNIYLRGPATYVFQGYLPI